MVWWNEKRVKLWIEILSSGKPYDLCSLLRTMTLGVACPTPLNHTDSRGHPRGVAWAKEQWSRRGAPSRLAGVIGRGSRDRRDRSGEGSDRRGSPGVAVAARPVPTSVTALSSCAR